MVFISGNRFLIRANAMWTFLIVIFVIFSIKAILDLRQTTTSNIPLPDFPETMKSASV
jgi:hypothetical protein